MTIVSYKTYFKDIQQGDIADAFKTYFREYVDIAEATDPRLAVISSYIKHKLNIDESAANILREAVSFINCFAENGEITISVLDNVNINNYNLGSMLKLIEYGNTEVKGSRVLSRACEYILDNM